MEFFGFTREEWLTARFDTPEAAQGVGDLVDLLFNAQSRGALSGISPDAWVAIAQVSHDFARRLRDQFAFRDPGWRDTITLAARLSASRGDPYAADWVRLRSLLDSVP